MSDNVLVSIITVVYNGEKYIRQTIESVANQTYQNIEYIVVDGGSKDSTVDIVKSFNNVNIFISEPDEGLYDAMNKGIALSKGEIIGMINSDDWYEVGAVQKIVDAYLLNKKNKIFHADRFDVLDCGAKTIKKFNPSVFKFKFYGMTYNHPSMFIARDIYDDFKYNKKLRALSDYEFVLRCYMKYSSSFHYIPEAIVNYRLDGISGRMSLFEHLKEGWEVRKNCGYPYLLNVFSFLFNFSVNMFFRFLRWILK